MGARFWFVKLLQLFCGGYIMTLTFIEYGTFGKHGGARDPDSSYIIDTGSEERTQRRGLMKWR